MAIRIRLLLRQSAPPALAPSEVIALVNSGYESGRPELIVPEPLAARLGWWPPPPTALVETYESVSGTFQIHRLPGSLEVAAASSDRTGPWTGADTIIAPHDDEVLISDTLAGDLGLALLDTKKGVWAFRDVLATLYASEPRQLW